ncbi:hypothetical protein Tco_1154674 [Tanacetum coccineum]
MEIIIEQLARECHWPVTCPAQPQEQADEDEETVEEDDGGSKETYNTSCFRNFSRKQRNKISRCEETASGLNPDGVTTVRIYLKSQENSQKRANTDTRIRRVQKEAKESKPKPEISSLSQKQSKHGQQKSTRPTIFHFNPQSFTKIQK